MGFDHSKTERCESTYGALFPVDGCTMRESDGPPSGAMSSYSNSWEDYGQSSVQRSSDHTDGLGSSDFEARRRLSEQVGSTPD